MEPKDLLPILFERSNVERSNGTATLIEVTEQRRALADFFRTLKSPVLATSSG